jgi:ABC-type antimicrobial peptide transport system permease subunit
VREGGILVLSGAAIGLMAAIPLTRLMGGLVTHISPNDPLTLAGAVGLLTSAALLACYMPARRASRVNPVQALRGE